MTKPRPGLAALPDWPADMDRHVAAAYCGVSPNHFERHCPVRPVRMGRALLWRREDIDAWRRARPTVAPPRYAGPATDSRGLDLPPAGGDPAGREERPGTPDDNDDEAWLRRLDHAHEHPRA